MTRPGSSVVFTFRRENLARLFLVNVTTYRVPWWASLRWFIGRAEW